MNKYAINKLPSDVLKEVAEKHRKVRKLAKLSQAELAERSGVSLGSIKRFENTGQIAFESLLKLAFLLQYLEDFKDLFSVSGNTKEIEKLFSFKTQRK